MFNKDHWVTLTCDQCTRQFRAPRRHRNATLCPRCFNDNRATEWVRDTPQIDAGGFAIEPTPVSALEAIRQDHKGEYSE